MPSRIDDGISAGKPGALSKVEVEGRAEVEQKPIRIGDGISAGKRDREDEIAVEGQKRSRDPESGETNEAMERNRSRGAEA